MRLIALLALAFACALPGLANAQAAPSPMCAASTGQVCIWMGSGVQQNVWQGAWPPVPPASYGSWSSPPPPPPAGLAPAQFLDAVAKAKGGDTLTLAGPAPFPAATIRGRTFSPRLTITSADPAHPAELNGFDFLGSTGLTLLAVDIHRTDPINASSPVLNVVGSNDVQVVNSRIRGTRDAKTGLLMGKGVVVTGGGNFTLLNSEVLDLFKGVSGADVAGFTIQGNDLHNIRTSPIDAGGLITGALVDNNHIHDIVPDRTQGDHSDGIHFFTKSGERIKGLTISNNRMEMGGTSAVGTLGINIQGTPDPGGFVDLKVIGNVLRWNNNQGITENYIVSGEISGNKLYPAPGLDNPAHAPGIVLRATNGPNFKVFGNISKLGPSLKPYAAQNSILTAAQIGAIGAPAPAALPH